MRTAVCLSGQVRSIQFGWKSLFDNIILPLNADSFLHTWKDSPGSGWNGSSVEHFFQDKNFTGKKFESYNDWSKTKKASTHETQSPMFYSMHESNKLKQIHENENNFKYDLVIRARMDCLFQQQIPNIEIENVLNDENTYYIRGEGNHGNLTNEFYLFGHYFICDIFFFGSSYAMDKLTSVYEHGDILARGDDAMNDSEKKLGHVSSLYWLTPRNSEIRFCRQKQNNIFFSNYSDEGYKENEIL